MNTAVGETKSGKVLPLMQARVKGKIANRRRQQSNSGNFWMTVIKTAAKDSYSHPSTIEVHSDKQLGDIGDEWEGVVELTGYPRTYNSKPDPETGEIKKIQTADNHFRVIEE